MTDSDEPIPLADACTLFPRAKLTVSTLRAEAERGRLHIFKLGRSWHTTPRAMREMVIACQDAAPRPGCISTNPGNSGLSETERIFAAQDALRQTVTALKGACPPTSAKSIHRRQIGSR